MRRMTRMASLAALVLLLALLAPRLAMAHANEDHGAASAQSESPASAPHAPRTAAVGAPSCPGDHGGLCTCGGDAASLAKPAAVIAAHTAFATALVSAAGVALERPLARAPPRRFSLQFSRAPPSFS